MKTKGSPEPAAKAPVPLAGSTRLRWSDFHLVSAIHRAGNVAKACVELGMTHSTMLRKLDRIESRLHTRLFERGRASYSLTPAGHEIVDAALAFEPIARAAELRATGQDLKPSGEVRVSIASILLDHLMPPILAQFASAFPAVKIEFAATRAFANLRRREADVAIRIADEVPDWLVGRKLAALQFKIYERRGPRAALPLRTPAQLAQARRWIGFENDARDQKFDRWLAATVPAENVNLRVDNFTHALAMVRAGLGIALLPAFLEKAVPGLRPLSASIRELDTDLWLITHPELRSTARVQVMMRAFGPALARAVESAQA